MSPVHSYHTVYKVFLSFKVYFSWIHIIDEKTLTSRRNVCRSSNKSIGFVDIYDMYIDLFSSKMDMFIRKAFHVEFIVVQLVWCNPAGGVAHRECRVVQRGGFPYAQRILWRPLVLHGGLFHPPGARLLLSGPADLRLGKRCPSLRVAVRTGTRCEYREHIFLQERGNGAYQDSG